MEINNLTTNLLKSYQSESEFVKNFIESGKLNLGKNNKESELADLILEGKLRLELVEEIIDSYHIKAVNELLDKYYNSNMSDNTIYIKIAGTLEECSKSIELNKIEELIIVGKINQIDLNWIFNMSNFHYKIKTLDLRNAIIESCEISDWDPIVGGMISESYRKNTIRLGSMNTYPYFNKYILPKFITNIQADESDFWPISSIYISDENIFYSTKEDILYNKKQTEIILRPNKELNKGTM